MQRRFKTRIFAVVCALILALSLAVNIFAANFSDSKLPVPRYSSPEIKNIIVMIPDGMSIDGVALARWYKSYDTTTGTFDTSVSLNMDDLASGLVRTWWQKGNIIGGIVDSAPAGTAYASGIKTDDKVIGMTYDHKPVATILEAANLIGKSTGIVVTCEVQHATPATFTSHISNRGQQQIIAEQQVYNNIDVVLGGGVNRLTGRTDNENLINEIKSMDYEFVTTREDMFAVKSGKLWGMFGARELNFAMAYEFDRVGLELDEPSLAEMTTKAIELLSQNEDGFFLLVEGSKIDWTAHANDPIGLISDILAFDKAVGVALDYAKKNQDTMILIMSDHGTGGITIGNRDTQNAQAKLPYDSAAIDNFIVPLTKAKLTGEGVAFKFNEERTNIAEVMKEYYGIDDLTAEEIEVIKATSFGAMNNVVGLMLSERAYLGWTTHGHTGQEVNLFSYLPGDGRITGTIDNTDIAKIMAKTWNIDLEAVTQRLFNDAETAFKALGATVETDTDIASSGRMIVKKDGVIITILENKNYVIVENSYLVDSADGPAKVIIEGVVVNQDGKFYVPKSVIELIP